MVTSIFISCTITTVGNTFIKLAYAQNLSNSVPVLPSVPQYPHAGEFTGNSNNVSSNLNETFLGTNSTEKYLISLRLNVTDDPLIFNNTVTILAKEIKILGGKVLYILRSIGVIVIDAPRTNETQIYALQNDTSFVESVTKNKPVTAARND